MIKYNFFVAHQVKNRKDDFDLFDVYMQFCQWFDSIGLSVHRCNGVNGKIVKFFKNRFENKIKDKSTLKFGLYADYFYPEDDYDCASNLNWKAFVLFSKKGKCIISMPDDGSNESFFIENIFSNLPCLKNTDYLYFYKETVCFGLGFSMGYHSPDEDHPDGCEADELLENWGRIDRAKKDDYYIRDVFDFNYFSSAKLEALPEEKRRSLLRVMNQFGALSTHENLVQWVIKGEEQKRAKEELIKDHVLASYITHKDFFEAFPVVR